MIKLNISGTLGRFGYSNIPEEIMIDILTIATETAYVTAVKKAPYLANDPPVHIKDELKHSVDIDKKIGEVSIKLPYAYIAEFGSKHRIAHPYIRPAARAAQAKMKAVIRKSTKEAIDKEKAK
jgi:hypothetical protein